MEKGQIKIKAFTLCVSDLDQIMEIETLSFNTYDAFTKEDFQRSLGYNPDLCLAAEIDKRIVGDIISSIQGDGAEVASLAIHPAFRRFGVGSVLLNETIKRIKRYKADHIDLQVRKTNLDGFYFWRKMGFELIGEKPDFYGDGETAQLMRKYIN